MLATIAVNESAMGAVVHDLSSARGATVLSLDADSDDSETSSTSSSSSSSSSSTTTLPPTLTPLTAAQLTRVYAPPDPYGNSDTGGSGANSSSDFDSVRQIRARVPLKEMVGYLKHLRSLTGGRGTFVMSVDRYERMGVQRMRVALAEMRGVLI